MNLTEFTAAESRVLVALRQAVEAGQKSIQEIRRAEQAIQPWLEEIRRIQATAMATVNHITSRIREDEEREARLWR